MSAFLVGTAHIDALLTAGIAFHPASSPLRWYRPAEAPEEPLCARERWLTPQTAGRVGAVLLAENARSVNYHYDEDDIEVPYEFRPVPGTPDPLVVLKAIHCLEYQSGEHPEWFDSEAREFLNVLHRSAARELDGWLTAAGWPIKSHAVIAYRRD